MPAHLRVSLPDRPGALAALSRALADAGANVSSVVVIDREQGRAVDDLLLDWPYERPFDAVVRAVSDCPGARLHGLRHITEVAVTRDCDVLQQVLGDPAQAVETLVDALPHVVLADWAAVVDRRRPREAVHATAGSPLPLPELVGAFDRPRGLSVGEEAIVVVPLTGTSLLVLLARYTGPAFTRSEIDHVAALVSMAVAMTEASYRAATEAPPTTLTARVLGDVPVAQDCA